MKDHKVISIVTWLGCGNFGTSLQSYALHEKLKQLGYDVNIIVRSKIEFNYSLLKKIFLLLFYKLFRINLKINRISSFNKTKYNIRRVYVLGDHVYNLKYADVFISGSDQIWNTYYKYDSFYFLDFVGDFKRISYASSIGSESVKYEYREKVKEHLMRFNSISVREKKAVNVLSDLLQNKKNVVQVLDPTFLLDAKDWNRFVLEAKIDIDLNMNYILCYLLGCNKDYINQLQNVKLKTGIDNIVIITSLENPSFYYDNAIVCRDAGPIEFVKLIKNATIVCTDSFHATAMSINLSIDFVEFIRFNDNDLESQNSRIYDILNRYNLLYKIYNKYNDDWGCKVDYLSVKKLLDIDIDFSVNYLVKSIDN